MKNKNVPAFPCPTEIRMIASNHSSEEIIGYGGMDLRDYFAAKAMQSLILIHEKDSLCDFGDGIFKDLTLISYSYADSMMKARKE